MTTDNKSSRLRLAAGAAVVVAATWGMQGCAAVPLGHTASPAPAPIQTAQTGDGNLSCEELTSQIADLDRIAAPTGAASGVAQQAATGVATQAATRAVLSSGAAAIPFVGGLISAGMSVANSGAMANAQEQANQKMQAMQRKQYLLQILAAKKC